MFLAAVRISAACERPDKVQSEVGRTSRRWSKVVNEGVVAVSSTRLWRARYSGSSSSSPGGVPASMTSRHDAVWIQHQLRWCEAADLPTESTDAVSAPVADAQNGFWSRGCQRSCLSGCVLQ